MRVALFRQHRGDLLCSIISALTRGGYSHAGLYFEDTGDLIEAFWPAVHCRKLAPGEVGDIDFFRVAGVDSLTIERGIRTYADAAAAAHEPYSIEGLFRFLAPARVFLGDGVEGNGKLPTFCSQFVVEALLNGAGLRVLNAPSYEIDPSHLAWSPLLIRAPL